MVMEMKQYSNGYSEGRCPQSLGQNFEASVSVKEGSILERFNSIFSHRSTMKITPESNVLASHDADISKFQFSSLSFLIVDDSAMIRKLMCAKLKREGCRVDECEDGARAIQHLQTIIQENNRPYDVIAIDNVNESSFCLNSLDYFLSKCRI